MKPASIKKVDELSKFLEVVTRNQAKENWHRNNSEKDYDLLPKVV